MGSCTKLALNMIMQHSYYGLASDVQRCHERVALLPVLTLYFRFMPISLTDPIGLRMRHSTGDHRGLFFFFPQSLVLARRRRNATLHCAITAEGCVGDKR